MHINEQLIHQFYSDFEKRNYVGMQNAYASNAQFHDPVFQDLNSIQLRAMWQMLVTTARDLKVTCSEVSANDELGRCRWEATYTFTSTGRQVHNIIRAKFEFKNAKIIKHRDDFNLWRWSMMALGLPGVFLGWSPLIKNKIRRTAQMRLAKFISEKK